MSDTPTDTSSWDPKADLQELVNSTSMDAETRTIIDEQIRILQDQQARFGQVSAREEQDRGIFGWISP